MSRDKISSEGNLLSGRLSAQTWCLCIGVGLHAVTWFMATTVMPTVVLDIGGVALISWATAVYLTLSIVGGASGGLLKARYGARPILLATAVIFLFGTLLAAAAWNMPVFLAGRAVQGLAEGVIMALSYALVRDLFPTALVPRIFGLLAVVYAVAAVAGPLAAGSMAELVSWRAAFLLILPLIVLYAGLVFAGIPAASSGRAAGTFPGLRLLLVGCGVLAICVAGLTEAALVVLGWIAGALVLLMVALWLDRHAIEPLFPQRCFSLVDPVGLGLWVCLLLPLAVSGVYVFVPFMVQTATGSTALLAGVFSALTALAWSTGAIGVSRLPMRHSGAALLAGPVLITVGLVATGVCLRAVAILPTALCLLAIGGGFGICWAFLSQRTMSAARAGEEDITAGAIPTLNSAGGALGAAIAGLVGNAAGIAQGGDALDAVRTAPWIFSTGAAFAALGLIAAIRFTGMTRNAAPN